MRKRASYLTANSVTSWLFAGALALSAGWLLPIHYLPWSAFHSDAWVAGMLLVLSTVSLIKVRSQQPWSYFALFIAALAVVPIIQLATGQIRLMGTAWISSLYLIGFLLAILTGARWQLSRGSELTDALFLAIGAAATISVGMQLCQWLNVTEGCLCANDWVLPRATNNRISANLAQPNQLATLLLLGIVAHVWAWVKQTIGSWTTVLAIVFLLVGIALTESRMGATSLGLMLLCFWYWRHLWPRRQTPYVASALFLFFVTVFLLQTFFSHLMLLDHVSTALARGQAETRLDIWFMFGRAALHRPWLGYGWDQSVIAQVMTTTAQSSDQGLRNLMVSHAHNLFLDLVLWLGIPLGVLASVAIASWFGRAAQNVKNNQDALLVLGVLAMGTHAMLELPLYYAYFLLPLGLMVGMLDVRLNSRYAFATGLRPVVCLWIVCCALFFTVVRDYFALEQSYAELRLDSARIANKTPYEPPEVLVLTQLRDYIALARLEVEPNMDQVKIDWVENVTLVYPSEHNLLKLSTALALNGQTPQAQDWINKLCNLYPGVKCVKAEEEWKKSQNRFPQLDKVTWPVTTQIPIMAH